MCRVVCILMVFGQFIICVDEHKQRCKMEASQNKLLNYNYGDVRLGSAALSKIHVHV